MSVPQPSSTLHKFYTGLDETLQWFRRSISPKVKEVHNTSGGFVRLRDIGAAGDNASQLFARLSNRPPLNAADRVLVGYLEDGEAVILGRLLQTGENDGLRIESASSPIVTTNPTWSLDFDNNFILVAEDIGGGDTDIDEVNISLDFTKVMPRGGITQFPSPEIQGGRFVSLLNYHALPTLSGITLTANRVYYIPVYVQDACTIDAVVWNITTLVAGAMNAGIYAAQANMLPGARLRDATNVSYGATGVKTHSLSSSLALTGQTWYFIAIVAATAMAISGAAIAGAIPAFRGGAAGTMGQDAIFLAQEDITAGWTATPATASAGSGASNTYLHVVARTV